MTSVANAENVTIESVNAEIACISGDGAALCQYLGHTKEPSRIVIENIAWQLLANDPNGDPGPGNWKLVFQERGKKRGRPSKRSNSVTLRQEPANAVQAIAGGHNLAAGQYLLAKPVIDNDTKDALAAAFDPDGNSTWFLRFEHPKSGYPQSLLRTELEDADLGHTALVMYDENQSWKQVYFAVDAQRRLVNGHASATRIKRAVTKVRSARRLAAASKKFPK